MGETKANRRRGPKPEDLTGRRFGRLVAVSIAAGSLESRYRLRWMCRCDCGGTQVVRPDALKAGLTRSCGCLQPLAASANLRRYYESHAHAVVHGHSSSRNGKKPSPTYITWVGMRARCHNPKSAKYGRYGGRGIQVCERWRNCFKAFLDDMGPRPDGHTIDRIDPNGNYEPSNCRWVTHEQWLNRRATALPYLGHIELQLEEVNRMLRELQNVRKRLLASVKQHRNGPAS
jgi:hypothetical protein